MFLKNHPVFDIFSSVYMEWFSNITYNLKHQPKGPLVSYFSDTWEMICHMNQLEFCYIFCFLCILKISSRFWSSGFVIWEIRVCLDLPASKTESISTSYYFKGGETLHSCFVDDKKCKESILSLRTHSTSVFVSFHTAISHIDSELSHIDCVKREKCLPAKRINKPCSVEEWWQISSHLKNTECVD